MRPDTSGHGMQVGVIGLGSMGMGVAQSLLRAGLPASGYDIRAEAQEQFSELGGFRPPAPARWADTPEPLWSWW